MAENSPVYVNEEGEVVTDLAYQVPLADIAASDQMYNPFDSDVTGAGAFMGDFGSAGDLGELADLGDFGSAANDDFVVAGKILISSLTGHCKKCVYPFSVYYQILNLKTFISIFTILYLLKYSNKNIPINMLFHDGMKLKAIVTFDVYIYKYDIEKPFFTYIIAQMTM